MLGKLNYRKKRVMPVLHKQCPTRHQERNEELQFKWRGMLMKKAAGNQQHLQQETGYLVCQQFRIGFKHLLQGRSKVDHWRTISQTN